MNTISFMSANYVARQVNYHMTEGWSEGQSATNSHFQSIETFQPRFEEIIRDIHGLGFSAMDLWSAHLNPEWATSEHIKIAREILRPNLGVPQRLNAHVIR